MKVSKSSLQVDDRRESRNDDDGEVAEVVKVASGRLSFKRSSYLNANKGRRYVVE